MSETLRVREINERLRTDLARVTMSRAVYRIAAWLMLMVVIYALVLVHIGHQRLMLSQANAKAAGNAQARFESCRAANHEHVELLLKQDRVIKDQQLLIDDAIATARACDGGMPTRWADAR